MATKESLKKGLTFDDILLLPRYSDVLPRNVITSTKLTKKLTLNIPLLSAAMDTVTEAELAIALAREGGIGIIHRNLNTAEQAEQVLKVKKSESWIIHEPITLDINDTLEKALGIIEEKDVSSFPIIQEKKLVGIVTHRDLRFKTNPKMKMKEIMTKKLITIDQQTSRDKAMRIMDDNRIEKLPIVDRQGHLKGLITIKDIEKSKQFPNGCKDSEGRLRVGAAVGTHDIERVEALVKNDVDLVVLDTAHGNSTRVIQAVKEIKKRFNVDVCAGNVATLDAAETLASAGADIIKVGIGPGAICTTRVITGVGVPQITAIMECAEAARKHGVSIIADGGVKYSGDMAKAIAVGANAVMIGNLFAGTEETPGRIVFVQGRKFKHYRGMGSLGAMERGSKERYMQKGIAKDKLVPEGIEGIVPYRGKLSEVVYQLLGGLRSAMGYCGAKTVAEFQKNAKIIQITQASLKESHPHDVHITEEAPNYSTRDLMED
ncbi:IMP dehydrogenase [Candidatus Woesearchaeota archaeon]|nr:IMP dehydrogenase [Candidatus Woesearchaeota archaeon]